MNFEYIDCFKFTHFLFQFWTYNKFSKGCGIHYYEVNDLIPAPSQITGKKETGEEHMDKVYVSKSFNTTGRNYPHSLSFCKHRCVRNDKCQTYTVFGPDFDGEGKSTCVLNYGPPNYRKLPLAAFTFINGSFGYSFLTGFASATWHCPVQGKKN